MKPRWIVASILSVILIGLATYVATTAGMRCSSGWAKPWWLLLLAMLPPLAVYAWPVLYNLGGFRRFLVLTLRLGLFTSLILGH